MRKSQVKHDADDDNDGGAGTILRAKMAMQKSKFIAGVTLILLANEHENLLRVDYHYSQSRHHASVDCPARENIVAAGLHCSSCCSLLLPLLPLYYFSYRSPLVFLLHFITPPGALHCSSCCSTSLFLPLLTPATHPIPIPR